MSRVLVTGHAGFIGFHLTRILLSAGHRVAGIDNVNDYYDPALKRARLHELGDPPNLTHYEFALEDADRLHEVVDKFRPSVVIHLAAQAGVRYSIDNPASYIQSNIVGTFNLLESVRGHKVDHLMLASSSSVYGANHKVPFTESDPTDHPVSFYAATKKSTEVISHSYAHLYDIPTTVFRFFTVYGPWGRPDMALFKFVEKIQNGLPIDVYGEGNMRRDFTYVDDLVHAIDRLKDVVPMLGHPVGDHDSLSAIAPFRIVNIGGGEPVGLLPFISAVERALGTTAEQRLLPMQPGDVQQTYADPSLLRDLVGQVPTTSIAEGVRRFVEWRREYYPRAKGESGGPHD